ncbi:MAG: hypothetical protein LBJ44_09890 [Propionibacteriaceae bacterium]|nr:hypothetical protein [Propionibacteriaceae bacterium]
MAAAAVMSLGLVAPSSYAASTDEWMMSVDDIGGSSYRYTYMLWDTDESAFPRVAPGELIGSDLFPSFFDTEADAYQLESVTREGDGLTVDAVYWYAAEQGADWFDYSEIDLTGTSTYGALSVGFCNPIPAVCPDASIAAHNSASITVARLASEYVADVASVSVRLYDPNDPTGEEFIEVEDQTILANSFYEDLNTNYPSGLDAIYQMWYAGGIPVLTSIGYDYLYGTGDLVDSMTVDGVPWSTDYVNEEGWLYGVYRSDGNQWVRVDVSKFVGADVYRLYPGELVVWKYGPGEYYDLLIPPTLAFAA